KVSGEDVDSFVKAVSGEDLSGRAVDSLARAYFQGGTNFREQILKGNFSWTLDRMEKMGQARAADSSVMGQSEMDFLKELEIAQKYEGKLIRRSLAEIKASNAFYAEAELLSGGIARQGEAYKQAIGRIYDRCRNAKRDLESLQTGQDQAGSLKVVRTGQEDHFQDHQAGGTVTHSASQGQNRSRPGAGQTSL
ncbi:hypothetical protein WDW86_13335, partial [Bdellovibrionota bacterium FG-2]